MLFPKAILDAEWAADAPLREAMAIKRERWRVILRGLGLWLKAAQLAPEGKISSARVCQARTLTSADHAVRIPVIAPTRSDASRPPVPTDRDQCEGAVRCTR